MAVSLFSCSAESDHLGANLVGTYSANCTCDNYTTPATETTPVSFTMQIATAPDFNQLPYIEILNLNDDGSSDLAQVVTANSFYNGNVEDTLIGNELTLLYQRPNFNCNGTATKQ